MFSENNLQIRNTFFTLDIILVGKVTIIWQFKKKLFSDYFGDKVPQASLTSILTNFYLFNWMFRESHSDNYIDNNHVSLSICKQKKGISKCFRHDLWKEWLRIIVANFPFHVTFKDKHMSSNWVYQRDHVSCC